ncbi:unnamed protein product [Pedinophyceae sp. YPF-701]|nr:unnamed protein product [Pedinophyceae sp. YPF-701]
MSRVDTLFVTLRRGLAGTPKKQLEQLKTFGFTRPWQVVEVQNSAPIRGVLAKLVHMVTIETDNMYHERQERNQAKLATRDTLSVKHGSLDGVAAPVAPEDTVARVQAPYHPGARDSLFFRTKNRAPGHGYVRGIGKAKGVR